MYAKAGNISLLATLIALGLPFGGAQEANDQARLVLQNALRAHGGKMALEQSEKSKISSKGMVFPEGQKGVPFEAEVWVASSDKLKRVLRVTFDDGKRTLIQVLNGSKGWRKFDDDVVELTGDELKDIQHSEGGFPLMYPLLEDKKYHLTKLKDEAQGDRILIGVKVSTKGLNDLSYFFDRDTNLLVKVSGFSNNSRHKGKVVETRYENYKVISNAKLACKIMTFIDGRKYIEAETTSIEFLSNVDPAIFAKP